MTNEQMIIVTVGLLAVMMLIILWRLTERFGDVAKTALLVAGPGLIALRGEAETALATLGDRLAPAHDLLMAIKPYVDEPTDALYERIARLTGQPVEAVAAVGYRIWQEAEDLTDGDAMDDDPEQVVVTPPDGPQADRIAKAAREHIRRQSQESVK